MIVDHLLNLFIQLVKISFISVALIKQLSNFFPDHQINFHFTRTVDVVFVTEFVHEELRQLDPLFGLSGVLLSVRLSFYFGVHGK